MPQAARAQTSFLGGIWSGSAQGRFDDPAYATALNVCLNGFPIESGAWTRRPGTQHAWTTRNGTAARVIKYDFNGTAPYTVELTAGFARFRSGANLATTNDSTAVTAISGANPASMTLAAAVTWSTGDSGFFSGLGTIDPLLLDRIFLITKTDTTHFTLADAITGATLDGSTLQTFTTGTFNHIHEVTTPYTLSSWANVRLVQADSAAVLLNGSFTPQILTPTTQPNAALGVFANFSLAPAFFNDGPYLDPVAGGALVTPSGVNGNISLPISFTAYDSTRSYKIGDFVTSSSVNYQSLTNQNLGNTPAGSPTNWKAVSAGLAVGPNGFQNSDIGRLIRLFSEPAIWASGTTYAAGNVVSYLDAETGAYQYWTSLVSSNTNNQPGIDLTKWAVNATGGIWSWGIITSLLNTIAGGTGTNIGDETSGGGLAAAFDGTTTKSSNACATKSITFGARPFFSTFSTTSFIGKNYTGSPEQIASVTVFPASDLGFGTFAVGFGATPLPTVTLNLRAKASSPANSADGTLLGTVTVPGGQLTAASIPSNDQSTSWNYVWVETTATTPGVPPSEQCNISIYTAQLQFAAATGSGTSGAGVNVQILGASLLYTTPIRVWRLGLYSNTTGWPTCGTWAGGRLWLGGAIPNRFDACVANGVTGTTIDFTPTAPDGTVSGANGISYRINDPEVSQILWFSPEDRGIVVGMQSGEGLIFASANNNIITPLSIDFRRQTRHGCANVEPRRAEHTLLVVQKHQRKILEFFADVFSGKYSAPDLSVHTKALSQTGIQELAYQQELAPILWARRGDGTLLGCTYKRESLMSAQPPNFFGWHTHALGSGRTVASICDAGTPDGTLDSLAMTTVDSSGIYHVEVMTNIFEDGTPITSAWFLDDALAPTTYVINAQANTLTISGLWHLNGKTVQAFVGGLDAGDTGVPGNQGPYSDFLVTNGQITIPTDGSVNPRLTTMAVAQAQFANGGVLPLVVGFTYTSQGQVLRTAAQKESGAAKGAALGDMSRAGEYKLLLQDAQGIYVGSVLTDKLHPAVLRLDDQVNYAPNQLYSGIAWDALRHDYSRTNSPFAWQITRPLPATVVAVSFDLETEG